MFIKTNYTNIMKKQRIYSGRLLRLYNRLRSMKMTGKLLFIIMGIASTAWFLFRVIPKPSRAAYPCMRTAAPIMSTFVIWILANLGAIAFFRKSGRLWRHKRYTPAAALIIAGIFSGIFATVQITEKAKANSVDISERAIFTPNEPIGTGQGILPGRVVWTWNPDATVQNFTNSQATPFYDPAQFDQEVISSMIETSLQLMTGEDNNADSWSSMFKYFNEKKGKGAVDYSNGETIFIKVNEGTSSWLADNTTLERSYDSWKGDHEPIAETTPGITYAIIDQLVNVVGVSESDIWIADPRSHVWQHTYEYIVADFPGVNFGDKEDYTHLGRTKLTKDNLIDIWYSDQGDVMTTAEYEYLYDQTTEADYLINLACLKAHARAGITLTAKNHFGSQTRAEAAHLHPGLLSSQDNDQWDRLGYGKYRVQVDIMGSQYLGQNTLLFLVDGLFGSTEATEGPIHWVSAPFNGDWPNSILVSQDQVALESVCLDILAKEATLGGSDVWEDRPLKDGIDDYLQQAASSEYWPEGIVYDPEDMDSPIQSLGVHEHWNNSQDMQYSGNFGGDGIHLIRWVNGEIVGIGNKQSGFAQTFDVKTYPNPATERFSIEFELHKESNIEIRLTDLSGRTVRILDDRMVPAGTFTREYNTGDLPPGIYLCSVSAAQKGNTIFSGVKIQVGR
ncbi:MAG: DUF362 domain-containing protein [Bacteroidales bacterium]|nr:DUF362 domain-containing protein [Bacteroidales bacterium]